MATPVEAEDTPMPDVDAPANATNDARVAGQKQGTTDELYDAMIDMLEALYTYRDETGHDPSKLFHKRPNKRNVPGYYEVIKEPMAMSNLKAKLKERQYTRFSEFVRDCALIWHNAFTYNRPESIAYEDATAIKVVMENEIRRIVENGFAPASQSEWPDLGEIPEADDEVEGEGEEDEDGESGADDDDDEEGGDNSDGEMNQARRRGRRPSAPRRGDVQGESSAKRRGRPPKMLTPLEARIKSVLKGLKKLKYPTGVSMIHDFEKLPDKTAYPEYYNVIRSPLSLEQIKKYSKRKRYHSVDDCLAQLDVMFENAKAFNEAGSLIYNAAVKLKELAHQIAAEDRLKPDSAFSQLEKVKPDGVLHKGQLWKIGDWVHIQNPNDATKPIVAQVYKIWEDDNGQDWINACWYYRPEQTVHHFEKHFWPNEVFKTSQYRDHAIGDLIDKCFVMFFTRYTKGRPRGLPEGTEVYVCEARYNEDKKQINKIKTWSSCLPNEVRDHNYELDPFSQQVIIKKQPTPLQHLVKDAKDPSHFPLPEPRWGTDEAPPIEGGVFAGPRDEHQSPPPPPTPPPEPIQQTRPPSSTPARETPSKQPQHSEVDVAMAGAHQAFNITTNQTPGNFAPPKQSPAPALSSQSNQPHYGNRNTPQTLQQQTPRNIHDQSPSLQRATSTPQGHAISGRGSGAHDHGPVYLPDHVNSSIPADIRNLFQMDGKGRVLFWTEPNFPQRQVQSTDLMDSEGKGPSHLRTSIRYRAAKLREKMRAANDAATTGVDEKEVPAADEADGMNLDTSERQGTEVAISTVAHTKHNEQAVALNGAISGPVPQEQEGQEEQEGNQEVPLWRTSPVTEKELLLADPEDIIRIDARRVRPEDELFARGLGYRSFLNWAAVMRAGTRALYRQSCSAGTDWAGWAEARTQNNMHARQQALLQKRRGDTTARMEVETETDETQARAWNDDNPFREPEFYIEDVDPSYVGARWTGPNPYGNRTQ